METKYYSQRLTLLLLLACCVGIVSLRRIESACYKDLAQLLRLAGLRPVWRVPTGHQQPDQICICKFCRQNLEALSRLFAQILRFCPKASA